LRWRKKGRQRKASELKRASVYAGHCKAVRGEEAQRHSQGEEKGIASWGSGGRRRYKRKLERSRRRKEREKGGGGRADVRAFPDLGEGGGTPA